MNRRVFLKGGAIAMFGSGAAPLWLARTASAATADRRKVLVAEWNAAPVKASGSE